MLNKEVCIRCFKANGEDWCYADNYWWWRLRKVMCYAVINEDGGKSFYGIRNKPPKDCPYALEHLVSVKTC